MELILPKHFLRVLSFSHAPTAITLLCLNVLTAAHRPAFCFPGVSSQPRAGTQRHVASMATSRSQHVTGYPLILTHSVTAPSHLPYYFLIQNHLRKLTAQPLLNAQSRWTGSELNLSALACFLPPLGYTRRTGIPTPDGRNTGTTGWRGQDMTLRRSVCGQTFTASPGPTESNLGSRLLPCPGTRPEGTNEASLNDLQHCV